MRIWAAFPSSAPNLFIAKAYVRRYKKDFRSSRAAKMPFSLLIKKGLKYRYFRPFFISVILILILRHANLQLLHRYHCLSCGFRIF